MVSFIIWYPYYILQLTIFTKILYNTALFSDDKLHNAWVFLTRRNFGEIVRTCILSRLILTFQARVTKPRLLLIIDHGAGVQVRKCCERIPYLPDRRGTVVGETLVQQSQVTVVTDCSSIIKLYFNLVKFPNSPIWQTFFFSTKTRCMIYI